MPGNSAIPRPEVRWIFWLGVWYGCWSEKNQKRQRCCSLLTLFKVLENLSNQQSGTHLGHFVTTLLSDLHMQSGPELLFYMPSMPSKVKARTCRILLPITGTPTRFPTPTPVRETPWYRAKSSGQNPVGKHICNLWNHLESVRILRHGHWRFDVFLLKGTQEKKLNHEVMLSSSPKAGAFVPNSWLSTILTSAITGPMLLPWQKYVKKHNSENTSRKAPEYQRCCHVSSVYPWILSMKSPRGSAVFSSIFFLMLPFKVA